MKKNPAIEKLHRQKTVKDNLALQLLHFSFFLIKGLSEIERRSRTFES